MKVRNGCCTVHSPSMHYAFMPYTSCRLNFPNIRPQEFEIDRCPVAATELDKLGSYLHGGGKGGTGNGLD